MNEKERLQLENELLMTCSKAQAINKYIDELEESSKLSELWCKSQQENKLLKYNWNELKKYIEDVIIECKTVINTILPEFEKITSRNSGKTLLTNEYNNQQMIIKSFKVMLSKMEELEKIRGDKDE